MLTVIYYECPPIGPPLPVGSLQGVLISLFTVYSNWSIPYTIMGVDITGYNINITRDNSESIVNQSFVTNTEYYYNVSQFGVYNISVAAVIGDELEGEINTVMVEVPEGIIINCYMIILYMIIIINTFVVLVHSSSIELFETISPTTGILYTTSTSYSTSIVYSTTTSSVVAIDQTIDIKYVTVFIICDQTMTPTAETTAQGRSLIIYSIIDKNVHVIYCYIGTLVIPIIG